MSNKRTPGWMVLIGLAVTLISFYGNDHGRLDTSAMFMAGQILFFVGSLGLGEQKAIARLSS